MNHCDGIYVNQLDAQICCGSAPFLVVEVVVVANLATASTKVVESFRAGEPRNARLLNEVFNW